MVLMLVPQPIKSAESWLKYEQGMLYSIILIIVRKDFVLGENRVTSSVLIMLSQYNRAKILYDILEHVEYWLVT